MREAQKLADAVLRKKTGKGLTHQRAYSSLGAFRRRFLQLTDDMSASQQYWRILTVNLSIIAALFLLSFTYHAGGYIDQLSTVANSHRPGRWLPGLATNTIWWVGCSIPFSYAIMRVWRRTTVGDGFTIGELIGLVGFVIIAISSTSLFLGSLAEAALYWTGWLIFALFYWVFMSNYFK
ncbi:MAG: hypothetical protein KI792_13320 [Alphaproteobacteria bacterium]|nr:hypothetical protein [Alphaproteobacteria bacterium SS10]